MKIDQKILNKMENLITERLKHVPEERIHEYFQKCKENAKESPVIYFSSNFVSSYYSARKLLGLPTYDTEIKDSHVFTAIKKVLQNNPKTKFIFTEPKQRG